MSDPSLMNLVVLPIAFGLIGFVEPCSIGTTLVLIKFLAGKDARTKVAQVTTFAATRAIFIGLLGVAAALLGTAFFAFQKAAWVALGVLFVGIGLLLVLGRGPLLMTTIGPGLGSLSGARGSIGLGLLFGLNIPACAVPLLIALLAAAAAQGATGGTLTAGFISLSLFGLALSLPLVAAVLFEPARRVLDRLARLSQSLPLWTGLILIALGLWSVWFGLFARLPV
jgi:cytochrome c-type biogenesis protein